MAKCPKTDESWTIIMQRPRTWALVADGVRARILRGLEGGAPVPQPPTELITRSRSQHLRDIMSDRPGRAHASDRGGRRSGMEPGSDPIRRDMQDFAHELMDRLNSHRRAGDFERLAIFAAPAMLGLLREAMPRAVRNTVFLERSQNLVQFDEAELRELVQREIGSQPGEVRA